MRTAVVATANFLIIIANSLDLVSLAPPQKVAIGAVG